MTPFLRFRLWLRHGPAVERALIGAVGVLVAAPLLVLIASDGGDSAIDIAIADSAAPRSSDEPPGEAMGERPATGTDTEQDRPGLPGSQLAPGGPGAAGTDLSGASTNAERCAGLRATDQGVSATEILVAVPVVNLAGEIGNESVGIRGNLAQVAQAAAAGINRQGGVACRQLRVKTYSVNPLDQTEQRARCLEIVRDKPFAVIDFAGYNDPANRRCFVDAEIPYQGYNILNEDEIASGRPFLYSFLASGDRALRNWVFEAAAHGLFDRGKGFRKLGLLVDECNPRAVEELSRNLERVGVPRQDTAMFTLQGCASINSPSELAQAVAQHRNNVTHVFLGVNSANGQNYVRQADAVRWKPVYSTSDFTSASNPVQAPR